MLSLRLNLRKQRLTSAPRVLCPVRVRAQRLLYCGLKQRELASSLFTFGLRGYVAWRLESLLDRISG